MVGFQPVRGVGAFSVAGSKAVAGMLRVGMEVRAVVVSEKMF